LSHQKIYQKYCSQIITFINLFGHSDGKTHSQIDHILIDRRQHSTVLDTQSFRQQIVIHFRKKTAGMFERINEHATHSKSKNLRDQYRGINELQGWLP
jgi:hypothetical protein